MLRSLALLSLLAPAIVAGEFASNHVFAGSSSNDRVIVFDVNGKQVSAVGGASALEDPGPMSFGPDGRLYVINKQSGRVHGINGNGQLVSTLGAFAGLDTPTAITVTPRGNLMVADDGAGTLIEMSRTGSLVAIFGNATLIPGVRDLVFGPDGHLFVASADASAVLEYDGSGVLLATHGAGLGLSDPASIAFDSAGKLFISSGDADEIVVLDREGALHARLEADLDLDQPGGLGFTADGNLVVVSRGSDEIVFLSPAGELLGRADKNYSQGDDLAVSPRRFGFRTTGTLIVDGGERVRVKQEGAISIQPGGLSMMVELDDLKSDDLIVAFGDEHMVLNGYEAYASAGEKRRIFQGSWFAGEASAPGSGSISLNVSGKVNKKTGEFEVRKAKGSLVRSGPGGVFVGKAITRKLLK